MKGTLKVRKITPSSLGFTIPKNVVEGLEIKKGLYIFDISKNLDTGNLNIELKLIKENI